ncbi:hypothetical protein LEC33_24055 [Salmonella enterica]|nr:hypothetical protein [Salmonella enterica]MDJ7049317.1 hypothetical protein [Salmonella enterica]MDJ7338569.1 hypothetical protein [Salmonella enterica]
MEADAAAICEAINSRRDGVVGVCESSQNAETADVQVSRIAASILMVFCTKNGKKNFFDKNFKLEFPVNKD